MRRRTPNAFRVSASLSCFLGAVFSMECGSPAARSIPVVSLSFEEGTRPGAFRPGLTSVNGILGKAVHFDGSPGSRLDAIPAGISSPATLSVWVRIECPREDLRLISRRDGDRDQAGTVRFKGCRVQAWNGDSWSDLSPFIAVNGSWQHLAIVFQEDGNAVGYVNGRQKQRRPAASTSRAVEFGVGAGFQATSASTFAGDMDEFRIYDRALPADEIGRLYSQRTVRPRRERRRNRRNASRGNRPRGIGRACAARAARRAAFLERILPPLHICSGIRFRSPCGRKSLQIHRNRSAGRQRDPFRNGRPHRRAQSHLGGDPRGERIAQGRGLGPPERHAAGGVRDPRFHQEPPVQRSRRAACLRLQGVRDKILIGPVRSRRFQMWLTENRPDPTCLYYGYPSKGMGAVISAMATYAALSPEPQDADKALVIARRAADFLINLTDKAPRPLAGWPPTYWNGLDPEKPTYYPDNNHDFLPGRSGDVLSRSLRCRSR